MSNKDKFNALRFNARSFVEASFGGESSRNLGVGPTAESFLEAGRRGEGIQRQDFSPDGEENEWAWGENWESELSFSECVYATPYIFTVHSE